MRILHRLCSLAFVTALVFTPGSNQASATIVTYTLDGTLTGETCLAETATGSGTASGTFTFDSSSCTFSNVNLTLANEVVCGTARPGFVINGANLCSATFGTEPGIHGLSDVFLFSNTTCQGIDVGVLPPLSSTEPMNLCCSTSGFFDPTNGITGFTSSATTIGTLTPGAAPEIDAQACTLPLALVGGILVMLGDRRVRTRTPTV